MKVAVFRASFQDVYMLNFKLSDRDKSFYSQMFKLTLPIVLQNFLSAAVNSVDVIMLNFVNQTAIASVSLATQYFMIFFMFMNGLGTGLSVLCSQYYGKNDFKSIKTILAIGMKISVALGLVFTLASLFVPDVMMMPYTNDEKLREVGAKYLRIVGITFLIWGFTESYYAALRSTGHVTVCTVMNVIANVLNILLNAVFIFGWLGFPKLGVSGVALATSISRLVQLAVTIAYSAFSKDMKITFSLLLLKNRMLFRDYIKVTIPAMLNDVSWGLAFSVYAAVMGHLGEDATAAYSLVGMIRNFGQVFCFALAVSGGLYLGKIMGNNQLEDAKKDAGKIINLTVLAGAVGGLIILALTPLTVDFAKITDQAKSYLEKMLLINTVYVMGSAVNTVLIAGIFRAGGDTKFGLVCDTIDMWAYAVPVALLASFVFKLPVMAVYVLLCTDEFVKWPWVIAHYKKRAWLKNITRDFES